MRHFYSILLLFITITTRAQSLSGLYTNTDIDKYSMLSLNLYSDSTFNYYFWKEGGYAITVIDKSGKYLISNDTLILKSIILKDTLRIGNTTIESDRKLNYIDYLDLQSIFYSRTSEFCIQVDDSLRKLFPETRFFINYDFGNEKPINQNNKILFDYPKSTILKYINIRNPYFGIDIDFDSYYHLIDKNNWKVEKNLLLIRTKKQLNTLKQKDFKTFAKYLIRDNSLILISSLEPYYRIMNNNDKTLILKKK